MRALRFGALTLVAAMLAMPANAEGQLGALKKRAEEEARRRKEASAKKAAEDSARKAAEKKTADSTKAAASQPSTAGQDNPAPSQASTAAQGQGAPKVWENYDFVPGSKVIFYTDFSEDRVGNFARGLRYRNGPAEVVERDGVKMLRATARSEFLIPVGAKLPERFTLEIDVIAPGRNAAEAVSFEGGAKFDRGPTSAAVSWNPLRSFYLGSGGDATSTVNYPDDVPPTLIGRVAHLRVLMDSGYFKFFVNERRIYNRPDFLFRRDSVIRLSIDAREDNGAPIYLTSIRVAESETDVMYDALASKGRWATHGILFATGRAELQPESHAVLREIASTLKQHGDLKVLIEGHTDNVGSAASNLTLSDTRAVAVKSALVTQYGIDGDRITTRGLGDTKPAVPNATATGRAQNRRVEVVKQ